MRLSTVRPLFALLFCCWAFGTAAQPLPITAPEMVGLASERLARIGQVIEEEVGKGNMPGAVVLVARKGQVAYFEAFGFLDRASGRRMPRDAVFRIRSMTKPLTSVAAMMLIEQGKMQLADPVAKWLPAMKAMQVLSADSSAGGGASDWKTVPAERQITIHDLLRHTAGIGATDGKVVPVREAFAAVALGPNDDRRAFSPAEYLERFSKVPLARQPGASWEYTGVSTDVLGCAIEAASGVRLSEVLARDLFRPLGMVDTGFRVPEAARGRLAEPMAPAPGREPVVPLMDVTRQMPRDSGAVGAVSTAADYFRFAQMLLEGGRVGQHRILSRPSVKLMISDHLGAIPSVDGIAGYTFGLGFAVRAGPGLAVVPGSTGDFSWGGDHGTYFWVDPEEKLVVVFMSQVLDRENARHRRMVKHLVYQAIAD